MSIGLGRSISIGIGRGISIGIRIGMGIGISIDIGKGRCISIGISMVKVIGTMELVEGMRSIPSKGTVITDLSGIATP